jgi:cyclopropane fatty-acyl-phospholipid synthase-like methyltransferase
VLGVALAPDQIEFCRERAKAAGVSDRVKFELMGLPRHRGEFDRITSVGLLEHVGTPQYPAFYEHTFKLLKPDGVYVLALLRPRPRAWGDRRLDAQIHLPGRLYPCPVRARHRKREGPAGK